MRRQRTQLFAEILESAVDILRLRTSRWLRRMSGASRSDDAGRRHDAPITRRGAPRARPTWRCPSPNVRERAFWARLLAQWKVDEPLPDFTERLIARLEASVRAQCAGRGVEAVELPDGGFNPRMCDAASTGVCPVEDPAMAAPPCSRVRPVLRMIRGGKATPRGVRDAASRGRSARAGDDEAPPSKPAA